MKLLATEKQENLPGFLKWAVDVTFWISALMILSMMGLVAYDSICRYIFNQPSRWIADTVTLYLMAAITFIPAAWILNKDGHPSVGLIVDRLKPGLRRVIDIINYVLCLVYSITLAWYGGGWAYEEFANHFTFSTAIPFPTWPAAGVVFLGGLVLCPVCVVRIVNLLKQKRTVRQ